MTKKLAIAIPARWASTRFPGKPLAKIAGKSMLARVVALAHEAASGIKNVDIFVTTEDIRIAEHAAEIGVECYITPDTCATGSDRVLAALEYVKERPDFVLNLQGDAPFTPISAIRNLIQAYRDNPELKVVTPIHQLSWDDLDRLRISKKTTPFSGTTAVIDAHGKALWFSKAIIPAIRKEAEIRSKNPISPIYQHIGLYGFRTDILEKFCTLPHGTYELLEGLEQLRFLEHGITIQTVMIDLDNGLIQSGIDSPEDLERAEQILATQENAP